jgi:hypothetical protein
MDATGVGGFEGANKGVEEASFDTLLSPLLLTTPAWMEISSPISMVAPFPRSIVKMTSEVQMQFAPDPRVLVVSEVKKLEQLPEDWSVEEENEHAMEVPSSASLQEFIAGAE